MGAFRIAMSYTVLLWVVAALVPTTALADTDACTILTPAQVGAAIGAPVALGTHVTPSFVRTCTWTPSGKSHVKAVTLYLQTAAAYDGGKQMAQRMAGASSGAAQKAASVGDDAYYFVVGEQVGLLVKKGSVSFKVAVYATLPVDQKETIEMALAKEALGRL